MHTKEFANQSLAQTVQVVVQGQAENRPSIAKRLKNIFYSPDMTFSDWENLEFRSRRLSRGVGHQRGF